MDDWLGGTDNDLIAEIKKVKEEKESKAKTAFGGLESALNIELGSTPIPKGLAKTVKKNTAVAIDAAKEVLANPEETFEDKEYIRETIKILIVKVQSTLEIMDGSILVGAEPRMFEVYSDMSKTLLDACSKLMALQKQSEMAKMMKTPPAADGEIALTETKTKSIKFKGNNMGDLLDQLRNGEISVDTPT